ncbi:hypothetical protein AGOR_G00027310 [Albula goreensis]|uniref:Ig-like domain-containing protein n=1 Tax=Albula goreensis TaxID=1534307 RepID=A0A8T3E1T9_9TELE|nr:hypothetical protein AGOR_G00027310 [Albula goreensis]
MKQAQTCAGSQPLCKILAVALVGLLYYITAEASLVVEPPKIVESPECRLRRQHIVCSCKAEPGFPDDFTLIYWLVNRTFIETAYPLGRVKEENEVNTVKDGKVLIQRDLTFRKLIKEDYKANYTCIVTSPAGMAKKTLKLKLKKAKRSSVKKRELTQHK